MDHEHFHLTEKHQNIGPLLYDIDLRYLKEEKPTRIYNQQFVIGLLDKIYQEIDKYLIIPKDLYKQAFIFEKTKPYEFNDTTMKDGIHIMFPYLNTCPELQYIIRDNLLKTCQEVIQTINITNPIDDVIDESIIFRNCWQLYGSFKPGNEPYKLTYLYNRQNDNIQEVPIDTSFYTNEYLVKLLSIRNRSIFSSLTETSKQEIDAYELVKINNRKKSIIVKSSRKKLGTKHNTTENLSVVKELIDILDSERSRSYKTWIEVGWCLHNIDYRLLDKWIEFSKKSSSHHKSCEKECTELWEYMNDEGLGMGSLHHWCKNDNIIGYKEIVHKDICNSLISSLDCTSYDTAKVVYQMFKHEFVCCSIQHKNWYEFTHHKWKELDGGISLRKKISNKTVDAYSELASTCLTKSQDSVHETPDKEIYMSRANKLTNISLKLRTTNFKNQVMQESGELFYSEKFYEDLDCNINLIGFENGVYDLKNFEFRDGRPEDYISLSTGINFVEHDDDDETVQEIYTFFEQVLPKERVRNYVLTLLASFLNGSTGNEKFHIWTGSGGNGKSKVIELFESAMGTYCAKLPHTIITQKRPASNAAAPELLRTKGRRFVCLQEPDDNEKIQVGFMKELTGGDKIQARGLYKEPVEFKPQFKMLLTCNHLPRIPSDDGGTWRRLRVVEFTSKFVEDPQEPNEFPIDMDLTEKMKDWNEAFMSILIKYYKRFKLGDESLGIKPGLHEPPEVLACTNNYRKFNDIYAEFLSENVEEYPNSQLKIEEIYSIFKIWYKESYTESKCPSKKELKGYMEKKYGPYGKGGGRKGGWRGIRLIPMDEDEDDLDDEQECPLDV